MIWFYLFIPIILILYILYKSLEFKINYSNWTTITRVLFILMVLLSLIPFFNILVFVAGIIIPMFMAIDGNVRFRKSGSKFFEYLNGRL